MTTDDLVERVGRELARTGYAFAGIDLTDPYTADADYWNSQARAAIAVALEEAAKEIERQATIAFEVDQCSHWERERILSLAAAIRAMIPKENK